MIEYDGSVFIKYDIDTRFDEKCYYTVNEFRLC